MSIETKETRAERFVRVAEQRTQRVVDAIQSLSNCASRVCYDYTPEQVEQIITALESEVRRLQSAFAGENRFTLRP